MVMCFNAHVGLKNTSKQASKAGWDGLQAFFFPASGHI